MNEPDDYYEILQVRPDASFSVIRASYKVLIQQHHPDRAANKLEAERITKLLNSAYAVLSDEELRAEYDHWRSSRDDLHSHKSAPNDNYDNKNGEASQAPDKEEVPEGVKGWSWGAFLLNWIWAIGNRTWVGVLAVIPYVGFIIAIILGFKGREWAWKNKKWESLDHFNKTQHIWSVWGVTLTAVFAFLGIGLAIALPAYDSYRTRTEAASATSGENFQSQGTPNNATPSVSYLQERISDLNEVDFNAGLEEWFAHHPDHNNNQDIDIVFSHLKDVYSQYPAIALGPALDMALQRAYRAARESVANSGPGITNQRNQQSPSFNGTWRKPTDPVPDSLNHSAYSNAAAQDAAADAADAADAAADAAEAAADAAEAAANY